MTAIWRMSGAISLYTNPRAIVVGAYDGRRMVGAATGMPLTDHDDDFGAALGRIGVACRTSFTVPNPFCCRAIAGRARGMPFSTRARIMRAGLA